VVLGVALGEALALILRAALVIAVTLDRVDKILLLVRESEVHEAAA
jgi:hypothetical protein